MKNIVLIIVFALSTTVIMAQTPTITHSGLSTCKFELTVDGSTLNRVDDCVFESPQVVDGPTYILEATAAVSYTHLTLPTTPYV